MCQQTGGQGGERTGEGGGGGPARVAGPGEAAPLPSLLQSPGSTSPRGYFIQKHLASIFFASGFNQNLSSFQNNRFVVARTISFSKFGSLVHKFISLTELIFIYITK